MLQQVDSDAEDQLLILCQARPRDGSRIHIAACLDLRRFRFQQVVERVAVLASGAAGAPCIAVKIDQPRLFGRLIARAAAYIDHSIDEGQLVILFEQNDEPILQLDALRLLRMKRMQRRNRNLRPRLRLLRARGNDGKKQNKSKQDVLRGAWRSSRPWRLIFP